METATVSQHRESRSLRGELRESLFTGLPARRGSAVSMREIARSEVFCFLALPLSGHDQSERETFSVDVCFRIVMNYAHSLRFGVDYEFL